MINPIMHELVAREQYNDRLREIEQARIVDAVATRQSVRSAELRAAIGHVISVVRYRFKALAYAK